MLGAWFLKYAIYNKMTKLNKNLLFLFGDSLESGGAKTRIISELENLSENSDNIRLVHLCKISEYKKYRKIKTLKINKSKFDFYIIPKFPNAIFLPIRILSNIINLIIATIYISYISQIKKVDLIHSHGMFSTFYSLPFIKITNTKIVFDCHGIIPEEEFYGDDKKENRLEYIILKIVEKIALKNSDLVITVSEKMSNHLRNIWDSDFFIMPMCVNSDFSFALEDREIIRNKLNLNKKRVIVYSGSLTEHQCPNQMFSFFKEIYETDNSYHFLIMVPKNYLNKAQFLSSNLEENSFTIVSVKRTMVPFLLTASDIGLLLRSESLVNQVSSPTKFSEYLASGLSVITTKYVGDSSNLIKKNKVGFILNSINSNVSTKIIDKISFLANEKSRDSCYKCVNDERLWSSYIDKLTIKYNQI